MRNICWAFLWLLLPFNALADTWRLTVTAKPVLEGTPNIYEYSIKIDEWDFLSQTPNPLYNCVKNSDFGSCEYAIGRRSESSFGSAIDGTERERTPHASDAKTIGELGSNIRVKDSYWWNKTFTYRSNTKRACFFLSYVLDGGSNLIFPGGHCTYADLSPTVCRIKEPYIELNHIVNQDDVENSIATSNLNISCSDKMTVRVVGKYPLDEIILDKKSNFRSLVTLNGDKISEGTRVNATPINTEINIKSVLKGSPPEGEYQGSMVLIIAPD
ncbi:TPA: hypothetical protein ACS7XF_001660 [Providencia alcalifaciens]